MESMMMMVERIATISMISSIPHAHAVSHTVARIASVSHTITRITSIAHTVTRIHSVSHAASKELSFHFLSPPQIVSNIVYVSLIKEE
jgi:hypothetical protein